mmetsp:Transcript_53894/g.109871  ORF Transcript_53894/g.109871 Transcript_53894/m.109871 type:complete len:201 (+) Transcript_53894:306-908(+)
MHPQRGRSRTLLFQMLLFSSRRSSLRVLTSPRCTQRRNSSSRPLRRRRASRTRLVPSRRSFRTRSCSRTRSNRSARRRTRTWPRSRRTLPSKSPSRAGTTGRRPSRRRSMLNCVSSLELTDKRSRGWTRPSPPPSRCTRRVKPSWLSCVRTHTTRRSRPRRPARQQRRTPRLWSTSPNPRRRSSIILWLRMPPSRTRRHT